MRGSTERRIVAHTLHPCTQESCTVALDGKCLEGLSLSECPYYQAYEDAEPDPREERGAPAPQQPTNGLPRVSCSMEAIT